MIMKKYLLIFIFSIFAFPCLGQISTCVNIGGYWGEWSNINSYFPQNHYTAYGTNAQFIIYDKYNHPSSYFFRVVITNFDFPDAKRKRKHLKTGEWYQYSGYVEYVPQRDGKGYSLDAFVRSFQSGNCYSNHEKVKTKAIIKIAPYKKEPQTYNVWFDNYGIGLILNWKKK